MLKKISFGLLLFIGFATNSVTAQYNQEKPTEEEAKKMVFGAQYIDRFLPIEPKKLTSDTWGAHTVVPRDIENGIEDDKYCYWGGSIVKGDDGKSHLFVTRWDANLYKSEVKQGHKFWSSSSVVHAISDDVLGPYKTIDSIGKCHNPEIYQKKDGMYIIGCMKDRAYRSKSLYGPWENFESKLEFTGKLGNTTNKTYIVEDDGSILMMNKEGYIFKSGDADEHFIQIDVPRAFTRGIINEKLGRSHEEDPVIWKDEVQYNLVMNDANTKRSYHLTSKDGIHNWVYEPGFAVRGPKTLRHKSGLYEGWRALERPKVVLDKYHRVTHMNFAAIDTLKSWERANDHHGSKNVVIPMVVAKRLKIMNKNKITASSKIELKILAEPGFNPIQEVDLASLRFGTSRATAFGGGSKAIKKEKSGKDLIVTFKVKDTGFEKDDYKGKLLGKSKKGALIFGYARLPQM